MTVSVVMAGVPGDKCRVRKDCGFSREYPNIDCNSVGICSEGKLGEPCGRANDCGSFNCNGKVCVPSTTKNIGDSCTNGLECVSTAMCIFDKCAYASSEGGPCESEHQCTGTSLDCINSVCTSVTKKNDGESCSRDVECRLFCKEGICYSGPTGGCVTDNDCNNGDICCARTGKCYSSANHQQGC